MATCKGCNMISAKWVTVEDSHSSNLSMSWREWLSISPMVLAWEAMMGDIGMALATFVFRWGVPRAITMAKALLAGWGLPGNNDATALVTAKWCCIFKSFPDLWAVSPITWWLPRRIGLRWWWDGALLLHVGCCHCWEYCGCCGCCCCYCLWSVNIASNWERTQWTEIDLYKAAAVAGVAEVVAVIAVQRKHLN